MEEKRDLNNPVENVVPDEMMPGFTAVESHEKAERSASETPEECSKPTEGKDAALEEKVAACPSKKSCPIGRYIFDGILLIAVIVLYILHFCGHKEVAPVVPAGKPGNGDIVYVNIDSINEKYEMVSLLMDSIDAEKQRQAVIFQNRQKALETKASNFQQNYQSGQLTQKQAEYAQISLQQESEKLQGDYEKAVEDLQVRYTAALAQIADSLSAAAARINAKHNASYVFTYQTAGQLIYADPTKDITQEVLDELNKPFHKKNKKKK